MDTVPKVNKTSLADLVCMSRKYSSVSDFINAHSQEGSGPNAFLVSHGSLDDVLVAGGVTIKKFAPYSTISGDISEIDRKAKSVFSEGSIVFELCWQWDAGARISKMVSVGRAKNMDIQLNNIRVSKSHGYLLLAYNKDNSTNEVYFIDGESSNGTFLNEVRLASSQKVVIPSGAKLRIGPYMFSCYSADEVYRKVLQALMQ